MNGNSCFLKLQENVTHNYKTNTAVTFPKKCLKERRARYAMNLLRIGFTPILGKIQKYCKGHHIHYYLFVH